MIELCNSSFQKHHIEIRHWIVEPTDELSQRVFDLLTEAANAVFDEAEKNVIIIDFTPAKTP